jgi:signal transduction histidine kinase/HAMP domain-containing protein
MAEEIKDDYKEKADLMSFHIIEDLESSMLRRNHEDIFRILDTYKGHKDVEEARLFNPKGKEMFVQQPGRHEPRVEEVFRTGAAIDFYQETDKGKVATFIIPIKNKPECHRCHEKSEPLRGALLLSLNQELMQQYIGQQQWKFIILFALLTLVVSTSTILAVNWLFLHKLRTIQQGAEAVEKGDFTYKIPVKSNDEVGALARGFNHMARTLQSVFEELEDKNRQLTEQFRLASRSQKEWQETFDCITDSVAVIDADCTILRANKAFRETFKEWMREYFSLPQNGAINKKCDELFGTCLLSDCPHKISVQDRRPTTREIYGRQTGKVFEVSIFPYYSSAEDFLGSVAIVKDVTEKKENELKLVMTERLAALGEMASGIAHELNNPLATIAVSTEALLNRVKKENIGSILFETYLRIIEDEVNRCKNITTSMLSFVRRTDNGKKGVNINEALDKTIEMVTFQGRLRDVVYLRNFEPEMPEVLGNENELRQAFLTIIVNALDAMGDRGALTIQTGAIPAIPALERSGRLNAEGGDGGFVFIKISDTGSGIPPHLITRIFAPFFTTKAEKGGTGLGLPIAKKIIDENGGKIEVASEEGKGTIFTVTLPVSQSRNSGD